MTGRLRTVRELAEELGGVGVDWVYSAVEAGLIPHRRLPGGRLIRFSDEDVAEIIAEAARPPVVVSMARRRRVTA